MSVFIRWLLDWVLRLNMVVFLDMTWKQVHRINFDEKLVCACPTCVCDGITNRQHFTDELTTETY